MDSPVRRPLIHTTDAFAAMGFRGASSGYEFIQKGLVTKPIRIGKSSCLPADEVDAINTARIAGASDDQIRALVTELHAKRTAPAAAA